MAARRLAHAAVQLRLSGVSDRHTSTESDRCGPYGESSWGAGVGTLSLRPVLLSLSTRVFGSPHSLLLKKVNIVNSPLAAARNCAEHAIVANRVALVSADEVKQKKW